MADADCRKLGEEMVAKATLARFIIGGAKGMIDGRKSVTVLVNPEKSKSAFEEEKNVNLMRDILERSRNIITISVRTGPVPSDFDGDMYVGK